MAPLLKAKVIIGSGGFPTTLQIHHICKTYGNTKCQAAANPDNTSTLPIFEGRSK